ncbi:MAG: glycosyltransferase [Opitutae bacterium]|nr:glycosyltransferase [Opitutae bacterium]
MNIAFFINKFPNIGGVESVTVLLANHFQSKGHKVSIISFEQVDFSILNDLDKNVRLYYLSHPVTSIKNTLRFRKILIKNNINVIFNQWCLPFITSAFCRLAGLGVNCPIISIHHNAPNENHRIRTCVEKLNRAESIFGKLKYKLLQYFWKFSTILSLQITYLISAKYIVLSEAFIPLFLNFTGVLNKGKVEAIPNPLTIPIEPINLEEYFSHKNNEIIYVGRLEENQKKIKRILDIWKAVYQSNKNWKLKIIGDGPDKEMLESYVKNNKIEKVYFEGFQNPINYYRSAKILMLTSDYEGFGLVITEAMAYGVVPLVYGSYDAIHDIIDNNVNGFILEKPFDVHQFIEKVNFLINNEAILRQCSLCSIEIKNKFSVEGVYNKWIDLLNRVIKHKLL